MIGRHLCTSHEWLRGADEGRRGVVYGYEDGAGGPWVLDALRDAIYWVYGTRQDGRPEECS